jgi:TRAP-type transport system periplasmic protein
MRRFLASICLVAFASVIGISASAKAEYKKEYKFSIIVGPSLVWCKTAEYFADEVRERTEGRVNIKVYPGGTLLAGQQLNEFMMLKRGVIDFAFDSTINWSPQITEMNLFSLPFFFPKGKYIYDAVDAVEKGKPGQKLFGIMDEKGVVGLAWGENGFRQLANNKREVKSVDDMKDLKIRIVGSPIFIDTYRALGADPMSINWGETVTGLQQGTVDGFENGINSIQRTLKVWQYTKYITTWDYVIDPIIFGVSKKTWDGFSPEDQSIIREAAIKWSKWQKEDARRGLLNYVTGIKGPGNSIFMEDPYKEFKDHKMTVTDMEMSEWKKFKSATEDVYQSWKEKIGSKFVESAEQIVGQYK